MSRDILKPRHQEVLKHLYRARYLTINQVWEMMFTKGEKSYATETLRDLKTWGFVRTRERPTVSSPFVYYLGAKGKHWLVKEGYCELAEINQTAGMAGGWEPPMPHDLSLSDLYVAFIKQCAKQTWQGFWKNTRQIKRDIGKVRVEPDAWLKVVSPKGTATAMIEFTDVVPTTGEYRAKLRGYSHLYAAFEPLPVLWFTTTLAKQNRLVGLARGWEYCDHLFFGLIEDRKDFLTANIYRWGSEEKANWLETGEASSSLHSPVAEPTC